MKKIVSFVLAALMLVSLVACAGGDDPEVTTTVADDTSANPDQSTSEVTTADPRFEVELPDEKYTGYTFHIGNTGYKDSKYTFSRLTADTQSGDIINDAIFKRTSEVEDRLGIIIEEDDLSVTDLKNAIATGDDYYGVATATLSNIMAIVNLNYTVDFNTIDTIHLDKPWWDQNAKEKLSFCDKLFYTFSDAAIYGMDNTRAMYFNKDMYKALFPDDAPLYELLADGNWTIQKFFNTATKAVADDGDGNWTETDTYGVANNNTTFYEVMLTGCESEIVQINADGDPYFFCHGQTQDKFVEVFNRLVNLFGLSDVYYKCSSADTSRAMFAQGQTLFTTDTLLMASLMRKEALNFGILPVPKYNAKQEKYLNVSPNGHAFFIPSTNTNLDRTGAIMEALSYYSSQYSDEKSLIPQYFELALKSKSSTDTESMESLQIIHDNISYVIKITGTTFSSAVYSKFNVNDKNITSFLTANEAANNKALAAVLDTFRD